MSSGEFVGGLMWAGEQRRNHVGRSCRHLAYMLGVLQSVLHGVQAASLLAAYCAGNLNTTHVPIYSMFSGMGHLVHPRAEIMQRLSPLASKPERVSRKNHHISE